MLNDSFAAVAIDIGHLKSTIGHAGSEIPGYVCDSYFTNFDNSKQNPNAMTVESGAISQNKYTFGEAIHSTIGNTIVHPIMQNGVSKKTPNFSSGQKCF